MASRADQQSEQQSNAFQTHFELLQSRQFRQARQAIDTRRQAAWLLRPEQIKDLAYTGQNPNKDHPVSMYNAIFWDGLRYAHCAV